MDLFASSLKQAKYNNSSSLGFIELSGRFALTRKNNCVQLKTHFF